MSVIWYKVISDLWNNKVRTALAVISIAAGVFAIGATFGLTDQLLRGMDTAHQAVNPSHINMFLRDDIDRTTAIRLKKVDGVVDIEVANREEIRYKRAPQEAWETGVLVMREDFNDQTYDVLQLKQGAWPTRKLFGIERLSSQNYNIDIGDTVIFEVDDRPKSYQINGTIRHPFVPPPQFGGPAHFFVDAEGLERFGTAAGEFRQLLVRVEPYSEPFARQIASEIKDRLAKEDIGVALTFYQDPEKHWGRFIVEGINFVLQVLAVVSLGASVVLVLNTLTALVTEQTNQIGIIKAIGGTTGIIVRIYLVGVLVYGLLALLIGLPLGMLVAFFGTQWLLNLFNIDYDTFQFSTRAVILQIVASVTVPLLAALWPVLKGASLTVREAIASYGLGSGRFGTSWIDRVVEIIGQSLLSTPYATALGNMFRRKGRLLLTQLVLIVAGTMFLAVMTLSSSVMATLNNEFERRQYDVQLVLEDEARLDQAVPLAEAHDSVREAEVWYSTSASILKAGQSTRDAGIGGELVGIPNGSDLFRPMMVAGRWLHPQDDRAVVILQDIATDHDIQLGDTITLDLAELGDHEWQVVGLYQSVLSGDVGNIEPIYANLQAVYRATKQHNTGDLLYVRTSGEYAAYSEAVGTQLETWFTAKNMKPLDSETIYEFRANVESQYSITITMLLMLAVVVAIVGGIGLMGSLSISVVERTREIGVMRAIGAKSFTIMGMFVLEGMLQGVASWAIAVPFSLILGRIMSDMMGQVMFDTNLDYLYNSNAVIIWLMIILIVSTLASVIPARSAIQISVRQSLAYQ